ncbi:MAG TPA: ABC transporter permease [Phaeodactylibacter sp.]|nr:ABC transporter permease [Phaeodactylibacter sp.]
MLFKIAYRNIWRSPLRSWVVIIAIALGVWALLLILGYVNGMTQSYINNAIREDLSHLQIHDKAFRDNPEAKYYLQNADSLSVALRQIPLKEQALPDIKAVTARSLAQGIIASAKSSRGVMVKGVIPGQEREVTQFDRNLAEGVWFGESPKKHPIIISTRLASLLKVGLHKKVVLTLQNTEGDVVATSFRIIGLYETNNNKRDELQVLILRKDLNDILNIPPHAAHEIAVLLDSDKKVDTLAARLRLVNPDWKVETYKQLAPEIELFQSQMKYTIGMIVFIVMLALVFGIINTMLMAVLERVRELGMLMAIGMNRRRVFGMIVLETLMLGIIGAPLGMVFMLLSMIHLGTTGLDLSAFSEGMQEFGLESIVIFQLPPEQYWQIGLAVLLTALIGSLYPAWKAIRLKPAEAIHAL